MYVNRMLCLNYNINVYQNKRLFFEILIDGSDLDLFLYFKMVPGSPRRHIQSDRR
jgi:hypothetical protein